MKPAAHFTNLDLQTRYPGLAPFKQGDSNIFFGRSEEIEQLHDLVQRHQQVLVYGKSGLGKSSLVNAGLVPRIQRERPTLFYFPRIGYWVDSNSNSPIASLLAEIHKQKPADANFLATASMREDTLWYQMKETALATENLQQVIVFDQFEELFSHPPEDIFHFKKQLGELMYRVVPEYFRTTLEYRMKSNPNLLTAAQLRELNTPMNVKVIYLIREDKYSQLNWLKDQLPDICAHTFEIKAMGKQQAREAVIFPARMSGEFKHPPFEFEEAAVEKILGKLADPVVQTIETTQLQIICRKIESLQHSLIRERDLPDFQELIGSYLKEVITKVPLLDRQSTSKFIETKLVHNGQRVPVAEQVCISEIGERALGILIESHLLRAEINGTGGTSYELGHDTMVAPIMENRRRRELEEALAQKRQEQEELDRIHREQEQDLRKKLEYAQHARKLEQRRLRKARILLGVASFALVGAIICGTYAWVQRTRLTQIEKDLIKQRNEAENALAREMKAFEFSRKESYKSAFAEANEHVSFNDYQSALNALMRVDSIYPGNDSISARMIYYKNKLGK